MISLPHAMPYIRIGGSVSPFANPTGSTRPSPTPPAAPTCPNGWRSTSPAASSVSSRTTTRQRDRFRRPLRPHREDPAVARARPRRRQDRQTPAARAHFPQRARPPPAPATNSPSSTSSRNSSVPPRTGAPPSSRCTDSATACAASSPQEVDAPVRASHGRDHRLRRRRQGALRPCQPRTPPRHRPMTLFEKIIAREIRPTSSTRMISPSPSATSIPRRRPHPRHPAQAHPRVGEARRRTDRSRHLLLVAQKVATDLGFNDPTKGFRLVINNGRYGGEAVPHLHVHLLSGREMGWPPG